MFINVGLLVLSSVSVFLVLVCADDKSDHQAHKRFLQQYKCSEPQPRALKLKQILIPDDIWDKYEGYTKDITPSVTVLHRCNSTGCCEAGQSCMPSNIDEVTLTFAVFLPKRVEYFKVKEKNHTECTCEEVDDNDIK